MLAVIPFPEAQCQDSWPGLLAALRAVGHHNQSLSEVLGDQQCFCCGRKELPLSSLCQEAAPEVLQRKEKSLVLQRCLVHTLTAMQRTGKNSAALSRWRLQGMWYLGKHRGISLKGISRKYKHSEECRKMGTERTVEVSSGVYNATACTKCTRLDPVPFSLLLLTEVAHVNVVTSCRWSFMSTMHLMHLPAKRSSPAQ